jgi:hypothetical protein
MCFIIQVSQKRFLGDIWDENLGYIGTKREFIMGGV